VNPTQIRLSLILLMFFLIGFGPISPTCLIGIYVVLIRPPWFHQLIHDLYQGKRRKGSWIPGRHIRLQTFLMLMTLLVIDVLPLPVTASLALPLILIRPLWVYQVVQGIYADA
jgi:hypothetical protein